MVYLSHFVALHSNSQPGHPALSVEVHKYIKDAQFTSTINPFSCLPPSRLAQLEYLLERLSQTKNTVERKRPIIRKQSSAEQRNEGVHMSCRAGRFYIDALVIRRNSAAGLLVLGSRP